MIEVKSFICNMLQENCYVVSDDTKECVIIDCGAYYKEEREALVDYIRSEQLKPVRLLCTHGHLDHNFGNDTILQEFGLYPEVTEADARMLENAKRQAQSFYGFNLDYELPRPQLHVVHGEQITFGRHALTVISTPGHSKGSVVYYCESEHTVFTGDTLFRQSIGRTDLESGSMLQIIQSLRTLAQLPDETIVYPGHGPLTTIGAELATNPFMDR